MWFSSHGFQAGGADDLCDRPAGIESPEPTCSGPGRQAEAQLPRSAQIYAFLQPVKYPRYHCTDVPAATHPHSCAHTWGKDPISATRPDEHYLLAYPPTHLVTPSRNHHTQLTIRSPPRATAKHPRPRILDQTSTQLYFFHRRSVAWLRQAGHPSFDIRSRRQPSQNLASSHLLNTS